MTEKVVVPKKVSRREQVLGNRGKTLYNMEADIKTLSKHARSFIEGKLTNIEEPL